MSVFRQLAALFCVLALFSAVPSLAEAPGPTATPTPVRISGGIGLFPAPGSLGGSDAGPLRRTCRFSGRNGSSCG